MDLAPLAGLTHLHGNCPPPAGDCLADIASLAGLAELELLSLANNDIEDISTLAGLTELSWLILANNRIKDLSRLLDNPGLGVGDYISLLGNPYDLAAAVPLAASGVPLAVPRPPPSPRRPLRRRHLRLAGNELRGDVQSLPDAPFTGDVIPELVVQMARAAFQQSLGLFAEALVNHWTQAKTSRWLPRILPEH